MENNIKDALEYAVNLAPAKTYEINGETYANKNLIRIDEKEDLRVDALRVSTLTGFTDYIIENRDEIDFTKTFVVVRDTKTVELISVPNKDKKRETYITAEAIIPSHNWGRWTDVEDFIIGMMSKFRPSEHREILMKFVGNMQEDQGIQTVDDGVSQKIVAKTGIANVSSVILPNPVYLHPYRSFQEIPQVGSNFIFRVRKGGECSLFEADGGEWMIRCRQEIKKYLEEKLVEVFGIVVIG